MDCPIEFNHSPHVLLGHGGGGRLTQKLVKEVFMPLIQSPELSEMHDGARMRLSSSECVVSTDAFVVKPLFFKGGDIGKLAVWGSANDVAMCGARPEALTMSFIIEEGFLIEDLKKIVSSIREACLKSNLRIVAADTKVVERGRGDGIYIQSTCLGEALSSEKISPLSIQVGDAIIVSGDLGRHGMAVLSERNGLEFESSIESDCAPLHGVVEDLITSGVKLHCLRDLTRGGLASALVEMSESSGKGFEIQEDLIVVSPQVRAACELLGIDVLQVANEGRFVVILPEAEVSRALEVMRRHEVSKGALRLGKIQNESGVVLKNSFGGSRIIDMLSGEQLPRIC